MWIFADSWYGMQWVFFSIFLILKRDIVFIIIIFTLKYILHPLLCAHASFFSLFENMYKARKKKQSTEYIITFDAYLFLFNIRLNGFHSVCLIIFP